MNARYWESWPLRIGVVSAVFLLASPVVAQDYWNLAHQLPPQSEDFQPPPNDLIGKWQGPFINQVGDASCWRVEPNAPEMPVGGEHGTQSVVGFVRLPPSALAGHDKRFQQSQLDGFAGGGWMSNLRPEDIPAGFFLEVKAHPVFKITKVEFHRSIPPIFAGPVLAVYADFLHEPPMGQCYFYLAAWIAQKQ